MAEKPRLFAFDIDIAASGTQRLLCGPLPPGWRIAFFNLFLGESAGALNNLRCTIRRFNVKRPPDTAAAFAANGELVGGAVGETPVLPFVSSAGFAIPVYFEADAAFGYLGLELTETGGVAAISGSAWVVAQPPRE